MANPSPDKGNVSRLLRIGGNMANVMFYLKQRPGYVISPGIAALMNLLCKQWDAARATPPSPSTAPEGTVSSYGTPVNELPAPPTLPRYLLDMIGEYGMARTDSVGQLEVQHRWEILIGGIKRYASEYGRALASRPAEVDDEGLPEVLFDGNAVYAEITRKLGKAHCHNHETVSATLDAVARLMRQGQRDAVAADRARVGRAMGLLREARAALETWKDVAPAVSLCADIDKVLAGGAR